MIITHSVSFEQLQDPVEFLSLHSLHWQFANVLPSEKHWSKEKNITQTSRISRWKSMALGLKKLQGMLVHDVGEGAMGFYPPWGRLCPRSSRAGFISVD
jgi:hypothetical protein